MESLHTKTEAADLNTLSTTSCSPYQTGIEDSVCEDDHHNDNKIEIARELLMELSFTGQTPSLQPNTIDLQFDQDNKKDLDLAQKNRSKFFQHQQHQQQQRYVEDEDRKPRTPCLTGRAVFRRKPVQMVTMPGSSSTLSFGRYSSHHKNVHDPNISGLPRTERSFISLSSLLEPRPDSPMTSSSRERHKPLHRFAPMLSVPPPQQTAFIEARRRQLRHLLASNTGHPPPNTPESCSSETVQYVFMPQKVTSSRCLTLGCSRSRSSGSDFSLHLSKHANSTQSKIIPPQKPIVLRMRTRHGQKTKPCPKNKEGEKSEKKSVINVNDASLAPTMLVNRWLELSGDNGSTYGTHLIKSSCRSDFPNKADTIHTNSPYSPTLLKTRHT